MKKVHRAGLPRPIETSVLAASSSGKPKLHFPLHTLMRGDFRLFHCSAWLWNGLFLSAPSHHLAPHIPIRQPPKTWGSRRIKECVCVCVCVCLLGGGGCGGKRERSWEDGEWKQITLKVIFFGGGGWRWKATPHHLYFLQINKKHHHGSVFFPAPPPTQFLFFGQ